MLILFLVQLVLNLEAIEAGDYEITLVLLMVLVLLLWIKGCWDLSWPFLNSVWAYWSTSTFGDCDCDYKCKE